MATLHATSTHSRRRGTVTADAAIHFACDPVSHHVCVVDASGALLEVFGEAGTLPGQFDRPSDAIVVSPRFDGEEALGERLAVVAVADRGNNRVQVFEPEGQLVAIIGGRDDASRLSFVDVTHTRWSDDVTPVDREGWPFFRLSAHPPVSDPVHLRWEDPWLVVVDGRGWETRVDLAAALLPSFDEWLAAASTPMLAAAHHHFRHKSRRSAVAAPLAALETALGVAWLESGDVEAVVRLWSLSWPQDLGSAIRHSQLCARDRAAMRAAFKLGGALAVSRVRAAIRLSVGAFAMPVIGGDRSGRATREAS